MNAAPVSKMLMPQWKQVEGEYVAPDEADSESEMDEQPVSGLHRRKRLKGKFAVTRCFKQAARHNSWARLLRRRSVV
jgi:hypothetical protein